MLRTIILSSIKNATLNRKKCIPIEPERGVLCEIEELLASGANVMQNKKC